VLLDVSMLQAPSLGVFGYCAPRKVHVMIAHRLRSRISCGGNATSLSQSCPISYFIPATLHCFILATVPRVVCV